MKKISQTSINPKCFRSSPRLNVHLYQQGNRGGRYISIPTNQQHKHSKSNYQQKKFFSNESFIPKTSNTLKLGGLSLTLLFGLISSQFFWKNEVRAEDEKKEEETERQFSKEEVKNHTTKETGIWVTFEHNVYDISEFIEEHPGGEEKIILAAGGALDPYIQNQKKYWSIYAVHKHQDVLDILAKYKIGVLQESDRIDTRTIDLTDPYAHDPIRSPILKVSNHKPFNAESPATLLADNYVTPTELFFVRNHLPVPTVDPQTYHLVIRGDDVPPITLTLEDLQTKFTQHTVMATLQCAGNRRSEMSTDAKPVKGLSWSQAAISNAEWTGVRLVDILQYAGINSDEDKYRHIQFEGLDVDPTGQIYGASIPSHKAFDVNQDVLVALQMNGQPIPRDHGYPVRLIAPGVVGARSVKWLSVIHAGKEESQSFWQQKDYKAFNPSVNWSNVDFSKAPAIQESPIQSAITEPAPGATIPDTGEITVKGYAFSGGGRGVIRVDVSADGGKTWMVADLKNPTEQPSHRAWAWTLWEAVVPVAESEKNVTLICKAVDASYNSQPDSADGIWNLRGVLNNSWHRIEVNLD